MNDTIKGHTLALFTAIVWGLTLISTKILLVEFKPVEILFYRFIMALIMLYIIAPKNSPKTTKKQEILLVFAGLFGICFYYLLENTALIYTMASNVGVINCLAPLFTAILMFILFKNREKMGANFFIGFILSIIGICLITFNGAKIHLNPLGDILAVGAAISWAFYSILIKKLADYGFSSLFITKKTFLYGTIFMIPFLYFFNFNLGLERFLNPINDINLLFLGLLASAICFATWSKAIKLLGAIKSSAYIY
ncbi:DMT family transporter, partial [bacterium]|nr:DMT family transporter [bacterium]